MAPQGQSGAGGADAASGGAEHAGALLPRWTTVLLLLMAVLAVFWTAHAARSFLLPLLVAVMLKFVLAPLVRLLDRRLRVPPTVGAGLLLLLLTSAILYGVVALSGPARNWIRDIPDLIADVRYRLQSLRVEDPVEEISAAADEVEQMTKPDNAPPVVAVADGTLLESLLSGVQSVFVFSALAIIFLYFLLITDGSVTRKLVTLAPRLRQKREIVTAIRSSEHQITRYISAVTVINLLLGAAVALFTWVAGMPTPLLWGVMAAFLNFVPYLGGVVGVTVVGLVAVGTYDTLGAAVVPPLGYVLLNSVEGLLITPAVLGRWHQLSPVAIFVWLILWSWLWGIAGALLAVPLLMFTKILCDHVPALQPAAVLLAPPRTRRRAVRAAGTAVATPLATEQSTP